MNFQKNAWVFRMVDLFAGSGGFSEGFRRTCERHGIQFDLTAINHWPTAVETHSKNHPNARHFCESVYEVDPRAVAPDGYLDCLTASQECIYHSNARGGGVCDDQSRSGAKDILRWVSAIEIPTIVIENVKEFMQWGPLHKIGPRKGLPIERQRGLEFRKFCAGLRELGYHIDFAVLNSADYGAYTARERFFMIACKGIPFAGWPEITHAKNPDRPFVKQWHSARDIIDWKLQGDSLFMRQAGLLEGKKPLVKNTIDRIVWGLEHISGIDPEPFLVMLYGTGKARSLDRPLPALTTKDHHGLCEPFLVKYFGSGANAVSTNRPLPTVTVKDRFGLIEPCLFDIRYRMLEPHELAAGMGFDGYKFCGTKTEIKKQIGNAVEVNQSTALAERVVMNWRNAA